MLLFFLGILVGVILIGSYFIFVTHIGVLIIDDTDPLEQKLRLILNEKAIEKKHRRVLLKIDRISEEQDKIAR